ncbi:MAG: 3-hydroxyacyl-CoA dehydrogenase NAD-binding domain-containing protein [Gemmatimonadaceae bacterium]
MAASMDRPTITTVAVVGAGVIGRSWALLFARAGCETRLHDRDAAQADRARRWVADVLADEASAGIRTAADAVACIARVSVVATLGEALTGAGYVQESAPERLDVKRELYAEMDGAAPPDAILGSSTSTFDMTAITAGLAGATRCVVAHPVNPPHQLPVVEVLGGQATDRDVVTQTAAFMASVGQRPVVLERFVPGFVLNRLQFALVREAMSLVQRGVASVDAVDAVVRDGLGLRWALMGPFGVADTNADGGIRAYYTGHEQLVTDLMNDLGPTPTIDAALVEELGRGVDAMLGGSERAEMRRWRDRMIARLRALKAGDPPPDIAAAASGPARPPSTVASIAEE